jgi:hypothetical protein
MSERSKMLKNARISTKARTPKRTKTPNRGKAPMAQTSHAPAPDCMILEQWVPPPSQATTARERRAASVSYSQNREKTAESDHLPPQSFRKKRRCWSWLVAEQVTNREKASQLLRNMRRRSLPRQT